MGRWRTQLGEEGLEYLHTTVLDSAVNMGALKRESCAHVCVDSTVMEKHITWPTDSKLLLSVLSKMVALMQDKRLSVRQSYARTAPRMAQKIGRYAHAKQFKRMKQLIRKLGTRTGRVARELERQLDQLNELEKMHAEHLITQAKKVIEQSRNRQKKDKLYSLHEPEMDCTGTPDRSKGKARQRYEFGVKDGITTRQDNGFVLGMRSYPGNTYDGVTLDDLLQQAETISEVAIETVAVDLGYRGKHDTNANVIHRGRKLGKREKKRLRRRAMIEAMIGRGGLPHMKNDGLLDRCHLRGKKRRCTARDLVWHRPQFALDVELPAGVSVSSGISGPFACAVLHPRFALPAEGLKVVIVTHVRRCRVGQLTHRETNHAGL